MKKLLIIFGVLATVLFVFGFASLHSQAEDNKMRFVKDAIPNRYIVVLEDWAAGA